MDDLLRLAERPVKLCSPVEPYEIDKRMRLGLQSILNRIVVTEAARGMGHELMLRIYLAGIYHGQALAARASQESPNV